jgi:hypothetical protein
MGPVDDESDDEQPVVRQWVRPETRHIYPTAHHGTSDTNQWDAGAVRPTWNAADIADNVDIRSSESGPADPPTPTVANGPVAGVK